MNTGLGWGIVKSRVIAAVEGEFILNATRSWKILNFLGDREVKGKCCYMGVFFYTSLGWEIVEPKVIAAVWVLCAVSFT